MKYRPEIDGLRSIAVLPVIIFHSGLNLLPGGYVGVDVFFVISGYLITTIIASEADDMNFSLLRFYERRFRRILPALFVVIVSTIPLSIIWIFPKDLVDYFQSIASVGIFSSNILFWLEADYFGGASELKPLLHTWSLAVEEQFYIFFPLILMGLSRFCCRARMLGVASLLLLSFALCEWMAYKDRTTAFYLIQFRAWELLSGALISLIILQNGQKKSDFLSGLGLTMIVIPMILFDSETIFPSHWTILPVLGAVLFIGYAGEGTISKQIVSNKLFVKVGLISYSLYLWHQPIFAFAKYRSIGEPSDGLIFLLICLIFSYPG